MAKESEIRGKFWSSLITHQTLMRCLAGVDKGHSKPMTAQPKSHDLFATIHGGLVADNRRATIYIYRLWPSIL